MNGFNIYKAPPLLLEKMNKICNLLRQGKKQYEEVADTITDKDFRITILTLAQESNQYACELSSQMQTLGGQQLEKINEPEPEDEITTLHNDENKILSFCNRNEKKVIGAYQEVLNDSFLYDGLQKMIGYQLKELLCNFMRLKQLGMLKFH